MSIKIQMQDGQGNIIHPQTDAELVQYKASNVNDVLVELEDREQVFIQEVEPADDGLWVDTSDQNSSPNGENIVATQIKKYIDEKITSKVDDCVEKVDEMEKDILSTNFNHIVTNQYSTALTDTKNGFANHEIIEGNTLQNYFVISNKTVTNENVGGERFTFYQKLQQQAVQVDGVYTLVNLSDKKLVVSKFNISTTEWDCEITLNPSEKKVINMGTISRFNAMFGRVEEGWTQDNCHLLPTSVLLLKGDWSDKEVPYRYFNGLASVGETNGLDIRIVGKNICPPLTLGNISNVTGSDIDSNSLMRSKLIKVKPNTEYACSNDGVSRGVNLFLYDGNANLINFIKASDLTNNNVVFTTGANVHYIRVTLGTTNYDKFQIEENSICSEYEPYREEIQLIHEPLRAIGDIKDIIDVNRGVIIRRIGKLILNGTTNENWTKSASGGYFAEQGISKNVNMKLYDSTQNIIPTVLSDRYIQSLHYVDDGFGDKTIRVGSVYPIQIIDTDFSDLDSFIARIQANPITVLYELETPIEEKINIAPLRLFEEARSVELVSNIKPTVTFDCPTNFKGIVESNTNAINKLYDERTITSNPNLLINGDFKVWQRGTQFVDRQGYCADRWFYVCWTNDNAKGSVERDGNALKITNFNGEQNYIEQIIESSNTLHLSGKVVTLSAKIKGSNLTSGDIFVQIVASNGIDRIDYSQATTKMNKINYSNITESYKSISVTFTLPENTTNIAVQIGNHCNLGSACNSNAIVNITDIKLEVGDKPTPYIPRNYAEELRDCQRYYVEYNSYNAWLSMNVTHGNYFEILIPTLTTMRKKPTVINNVNGAMQYYSSSGWVDIPATSYTLGCGFIRGAGRFTNETPHKNYLIKWMPSFDAEIY